MCGICGYLNFGKSPASEQKIRSMTSLIEHRGPDDEGIYIDKFFGMGMRRLSIIDLEGGHQPISNENNSIWIILNGEIYNHRILRAELIAKGHTFKTQSDTEVVLHLYEEYEYDFVKEIKGMFGLAIWDRNKEELILVRDPLGIKQVYFSTANNQFTFGSEIKCLLNRNETPEIDFEALNKYFSFLYFPDKTTIYKGIEKLRPGHLLSVRNGSVKVRQYWSLKEKKQIKIDFNTAQEEFLRLLKKSLEMHLISDVPVGIFLSGGIDSSAIVAIAHMVTSERLNTFTIGYGEEGRYYDEREYAKIISDLFDSNHHEFVVDPNIEEAIYKLIQYFDEPFANSSAIPNYYVSQVTRKSVKVALSGLGGDEIGGGYERYSGMNFLSIYNKFPSTIQNLIKHSINAFPESRNGNHLINRAKRFSAAANLSQTEAYYSFISTYAKDKELSLFNQKTKNLMNPQAPFEYLENVFNELNQDEILQKVMYFDLISYMPNDLLIVTDRTSMANSLEVRVPFLDRELVEFLFSLPVRYKIKYNDKKILFKKSLSSVLPRKILFRKKKGFSTPFSVWVRNDLNKFMNNTLSKERIERTEILKSDCVKQLLNEHVARRTNNQGLIFALITFIIWHETYIQKRTRNVTI